MKMKKKYKLKQPIKTALVIAFIYLLFIVYVCCYSMRIEKLNSNSYTSEGHNRSITIIK